MDKRTLLAVLLAVAFYYLWLQWVASNQVVEGPPPQTTVEVETPPPVPAEAPPPVEPVPAATDLPVRQIPWQACGMKGEWTTATGTLEDVQLKGHEEPYDVTPLWRWVIGGMQGSWRPYGGEPGPATIITETGRALGVGTGDLTSASPPVEVVEESDTRLVLRGRTADGIEVTRTVTAPRGAEDCLVDVQITWRNTTQAPWRGDLWVGVHDAMDPDAGAYESASRPVAYVAEDFEKFQKIHKLEEPELREGPVRWFGVADTYFALVLLTEPQSQGQLWFTPRQTSSGVEFGEQYVLPTRDLAPGGAHTEQFRLYAGPKEMGPLKAIDPTLGELVELGFFGFFARILLWLLELFYGFVGNWGISIILLTVLVKAVFFPLTQMSFKSSQAMSALQPELTRLREELKDNQEELNRRMVELFRENGVNPLGGCLPMLVQMPIWFALYSVLLTSVALYHTEFLYLKDLSVADPYMVLPAVVVVLMVVQQQMMPMGNLDPAQARMMKLMPLIFGVFFFTFPSGLVLYIFVNMVLTILQQWYIRRAFPSPAPAAAVQTEGGK